MGCLSDHLRNFRWKRFAVNATFDLTEGWKIAQYFKPDYILIDGLFQPEAIKTFIGQIRERKSTQSATIALLKDNSATELVIPGVQDYLLKDNIILDTFAFDVLNAIALKIQEDERRVFQLSTAASSAWSFGLFKRPSVSN